MIRQPPTAAHTKLYRTFLEAGENESEYEPDSPAPANQPSTPTTPKQTSRILDPEDSPFSERFDEQAESKSTSSTHRTPSRDKIEARMVPRRSPGSCGWFTSCTQTIFPHFLSHEYFVQLHNGSGQHFLTPGASARSFTGNYFERMFRTSGKIGSGEFSNVYRVQELSTGRLYAIKRNKYRFQGPRDRTRHLEEVEILWKIEGREHCAQIKNAWEQHGYLYIQLELCEHGSLHDFMEKYCQYESLEERYIWHIIAQIGHGLKNLHHLGILHLDLKPANILVTERCTLQVGDFGLAAIEPLRENIEREGDREYLAPEIFEGNYGKFADIFSLGLIALEMAANVVLPDNGEAWQKLRSADLSDCDLEHVSPALVELILAMIDPDPSQRPTVDAVLSHPSIQETSQSNGLLELFTHHGGLN